MTYSKKILALIVSVCSVMTVCGQKARISLATDASLLRSFKKDQRYWSVGQTIHFHYHLTAKDGAYAWFAYYSNGKFSNTLNATAKSSTTVPQSVNYLNKAEMLFKHVSLGWTRYLKGSFDAEKSWSLYGYAGFGLMFGQVVNSHSVSIDTSIYNVPVLNGEAKFKRLTLDLGLGAEFPFGGDIYFYAEGRVLVPTTDYPSQYLLVNQNAPLTAAINAGFRILF